MRLFSNITSALALGAMTLASNPVLARGGADQDELRAKLKATLAEARADDAAHDCRGSMLGFLFGDRNETISEASQEAEPKIR